MAFNCEIQFKTDCGQFSNQVIKWVTSSDVTQGLVSGRVSVPLFEGEPNVYVTPDSIVYLKQVAV